MTPRVYSLHGTKEVHDSDLVQLHCTKEVHGSESTTHSNQLFEQGKRTAFLNNRLNVVKFCEAGIHFKMALINGNIFLLLFKFFQWFALIKQIW